LPVADRASIKSPHQRWTRPAAQFKSAHAHWLILLQCPPGDDWRSMGHFRTSLSMLACVRSSCCVKYPDFICVGASQGTDGAVIRASAPACSRPCTELMTAKLAIDPASNAAVSAALAKHPVSAPVCDMVFILASLDQPSLCCKPWLSSAFTKERAATSSASNT
jgi:hypothetical protein